MKELNIIKIYWKWNFYLISLNGWIRVWKFTTYLSKETKAMWEFIIQAHNIPPMSLLGMELIMNLEVDLETVDLKKITEGFICVQDVMKRWKIKIGHQDIKNQRNLVQNNRVIHKIANNNLNLMAIRKMIQIEKKWLNPQNLLLSSKKITL